MEEVDDRLVYKQLHGSDSIVDGQHRAIIFKHIMIDNIHSPFNMLCHLSKLIFTLKCMDYPKVIGCKKVQYQSAFMLAQWDERIIELHHYIRQLFIDISTTMINDIDSYIDDMDINKIYTIVDTVYKTLFSFMEEWNEHTDIRMVLLFRSWGICFMSAVCTHLPQKDIDKGRKLLCHIEKSSSLWKEHGCNIIRHGLCPYMEGYSDYDEYDYYHPISQDNYLSILWRVLIARFLYSIYDNNITNKNLYLLNYK